ncbi:MAG: ABC transporter permease [Chromatiaceae bacterium]|nr:ABC transporter permease [Chromatiaceae bacterium]
MPVLLLTDIFVLLLLGLMLAYGLYAARHEHLRAPWRRVVASRVGMMSLVVLGSYAAIGLLDTVHFHPRLEAKAGVGAGGASSEVLSLLDLWLAPLRERQEKTYSAPFATHLHAMETLVQPDGTSRRDYPRLVHGGAHLAAPEGDRGRDILMTSVSGLMKGLALWALVTMVAAALLAWRRRRGQGRNPLPGLVGGWGLALRDLVRGRTQWPWRTGLLTLGVILILGAVTAELAVKYHVLGTDKVGEDVLYQALKSIRTGLVIGTLTTLVMLPAAILLGIMAGYYRGLTDDVIQYLYTTLNSIPGVLLIAAAVLMLQVHMSNHEAEFTSLAQRADLRLFFLCLILGVTSWTGLCRLLRGEALKLREVDYVQAAQALGVGSLSILARHILPNVLHLVIIALALDFSGLVLAEAVLSYINIGVDPTMNSWGNMINGARLELAREPLVWWSLASAFLFMFILVLFANLLADVVRDAFDPRLRGA